MTLFTRTSREDVLDGFGRPIRQFAAAAAAMARTLANRRAAHRIADMPDYLLTDIGLKRDDVHDALNRRWRDDPTYRLALAASRRRHAR